MTDDQRAKLDAILTAHDQAFAVFQETVKDVAEASAKARQARVILTDVEDVLQDALNRHDAAIVAVMKANREALALFHGQ